MYIQKNKKPAEKAIDSMSSAQYKRGDIEFEDNRNEFSIQKKIKENIQNQPIQRQVYLFRSERSQRAPRTGTISGTQTQSSPVASTTASTSRLPGRQRGQTGTTPSAGTAPRPSPSSTPVQRPQRPPSAATPPTGFASITPTQLEEVQRRLTPNENRLLTQWINDRLERCFSSINDLVRQIRSASAMPSSGPEAASPFLDREMPVENATRVGFEIENGWHCRFPLNQRNILENIVNQTLAEFVITNARRRRFVILQMVFDDLSEGDHYIDMQIEFRTPPMNFSQITRDLDASLRTAIGHFPRTMVTDPRNSGDIVTLLGTGHWQRAPALPANGFPNARMPRSMTPPLILAQHATTSIELAAFSKLSPRQQQLLFPRGAGVTSKQELINRLGEIVLANDSINATTSSGRNAQGATVKTPIEALLAADPSLQAPPTDRSQEVYVAIPPQFHYRLGRPMSDVVDEIRATRHFPTIQGDRGLGYRAIAEKLQPPLIDRRYGELRVLVEHRQSDIAPLLSAVREALAGRSEELRSIRAAAHAMDEISRDSTSRGQSRLTRPGAIEFLESLRPASGARLSPSESVEIAPTGTTTTSSAPPVLSEESTGSDRSGSRRPVVPGPPARIALPARTLNLAGLIQHYGPGIEWAIRQGTFSPEFLMFRDHPDQALARLTQAGLIAETIEYIRAQLPQLIQDHHAQEGHPEAATQEAIFETLMPLGTYLWALLRYLNAIG